MEQKERHAGGVPGTGAGAAGWAGRGEGDLLDRTVRILVLATEILTLEEPDEISRRVVAALVEELELPVVSILLADDQGELRYAADHGVAEAVKASGFRKDGTAYTAFHTCEASFVEDAGHDARVNPRTRHLLGAYASLPIHHRGRCYGVIMVTFMTPHEFPPIERVTLTTFAHQMGIALDNGRLHRQERARIAFLAAQADLSKALSATLQRRDVARILGETLEATLAGAGVVVWTEHNRSLELAFAAGLGQGEEPRASVRVIDSHVLARLGEALQGDVALEDLAADLGLGAGSLPGGRPYALQLLCSGALEGLLLLLPGREPLDPALVRALGERTALALRNAKLYEDSQAAASIDPLTGLLNRRAFAGSARGLVDSAARTGVPLSLLMLDADHFKVCNDTYGHPVGDRVLVLLAQILRAQIRPSDLVGRLGGEEFAVLLQCATQDTAFRVAERIRSAMADSRLDLGGGLTIQVPTVSVGVANLTPDESLDSLLVRADAALYRAKGEGRNRTCLS